MAKNWKTGNTYKVGKLYVYVTDRFWEGKRYRVGKTNKVFVTGFYDSIKVFKTKQAAINFAKKY